MTAHGTAAPLDDLLEGVRIIEWTGRAGAYTGRLLADLGADVIRVVPTAGDPVATAPPVVERAGVRFSGFERFVNLNKRSVALDPATDEGRATFDELLAGADVFVDGAPLEDRERFGWTDEDLAERHPRLVHVSVLPFGATGPYARYRGGDLVQMAAGGLLSLAGYPDSAPTLAHGGQSDFAASIYAAVAAVVGLLARDQTGTGSTLDLSAQAVVAGALEDSVAQADLTGAVRRRIGDAPREAGTGTFPCRDGFIAMVAGRLGTAAAWKSLTRWLAEEGVEGAEEMCGETWEDFRFRQSEPAIAHFDEVFRRFTSGLTKEYLYEEGQRRRIAIAPVNTIRDVLDDVQLAHRAFFRSVADDHVGGELRYPGTPYRVDGSAGTRSTAAPAAGADADEVLAFESLGESA